LATALVFLSLNGIELEDPNEELYDLLMDVSGKGKPKSDIAATFKRLHISKKRAK
jgi:prophage maintenance system killer protein